MAKCNVKKISEKEACKWLKNRRQYCGIKKLSRFRWFKNGLEWSDVCDRAKQEIKRFNDSKNRERQTIAWLEDNNSDIELIAYSGSSIVPSKFRCKKCGHAWMASFSKLRSSGGCPKCSNKCRNKLEDVKEWLNKYGIELVEYSGLFSSKSRFRCMNCGCEWITTMTNIKRGNGCPRCTKKEVKRVWYPDFKMKGKKIEVKPDMTGENVAEWLKKNRPEIEVINYGGKTKPSVFRRKSDGYMWSGNLDSVKVGTANQYELSQEYVEGWLKEVRPEIELVKYSGSLIRPSVFKCKVCGLMWSVRFADIKLGRGCPGCDRAQVNKAA